MPPKYLRVEHVFAVVNDRLGYAYSGADTAGQAWTNFMTWCKTSSWPEELKMTRRELGRRGYRVIKFKRVPRGGKTK